MKHSIRFLLVFLSALCLTQISSNLLAADAQNQNDTEVALRAAISGAQRSEQNKARDRYRHPLETLTFFGIEPNMTVVEIWPGNGWYTEILAPFLKDHGKLYEALGGGRAQRHFRISSRLTRLSIVRSP